MLCFVKDYVLYVHLAYKDDDLWTVRSTNDNDWKTCKMSKVYARSHEITNKPCTGSYYEQTTVYNAEKHASNVKKNEESS